MREPIHPFALLALNNTFRGQDLHDLQNFDLRTSAVEVSGVWRGMPERSWIVPLLYPEHKTWVQNLAKKRNQESVLFVRADRTAYLKYMADGREEELGTWRNVMRDVATKQDSYTYYPEANAYYICM